MEKAGYFTPLLHVRQVETSIRFYELLGFETVDTDRCVPIGWARLHCDGGAVMFLRAEDEVKTAELPAMFYMYTPNLPELRDALIRANVAVSAITYPGYMPSGEMNLKDPDGYRIGIGHWSQKEHTAWLERIRPTGQDEPSGA